MEDAKATFEEESPLEDEGDFSDLFVDLEDAFGEDPDFIFEDQDDDPPTGTYARSRRRRTSTKSAPAIIARIRQRLEDGSQFYHPANGFNEERKKSVDFSGKNFIPGSRMYLISAKEYNDELNAVEALVSYWHRKLFLTDEFQLAQLVGSIGMHPEEARRFQLAERYTFDPDASEYTPSCEPKESPECVRTIERFTGLFAREQYLQSPFHKRWRTYRRSLNGKCSYEPPAKDADVQSYLTRTLWRYCPELPTETILGTLLLQPDYGAADMQLLEELACG